MKRTAFTLVEMMLVMAILALLLAILLPSMSSAYAVARATVCKGNLRRLSDAFTTSGSVRTLNAGGKGSVRDVINAFPRPMSWPTIPFDVVASPDLYRCPEEEVQEGKQTLLGSLKSLEYINEYGSFPMDSTEGLSSFYLSQRGSDENGAFTDYMLQDDEGNGQLELMDFHKWVDTDGLVRVYDSGLVHIFDRVPSTPDYEGCGGPGYPDRVNTCGNLNAMNYNGKPAFGTDGILRNHRGKSYQLSDWNLGLTNYGINSYAFQYPFGADCIVLVDYKDTIVDVDNPVEAEGLLLQSARHLGRVNFLMGDGTVRTNVPLNISPRIDLPLWQP